MEKRERRGGKYRESGGFTSSASELSHFQEFPQERKEKGEEKPVYYDYQQVSRVECIERNEIK